MVSTYVISLIYCCHCHDYVHMHVSDLKPNLVINYTQISLSVEELDLHDHSLQHYFCFIVATTRNKITVV